MRKKRTLTIPPNIRHEIYEWANGGFLVFYFNSETTQPEVVSNFDDSKSAFALQSFIDTWLYAVKVERIRSIKETYNESDELEKEEDYSCFIDEDTLANLIDKGIEKSPSKEHRVENSDQFPQELVSRLGDVTGNTFLMFYFGADDLPKIEYRFRSHRDALGLQEFVKCWYSAFYENSIGLMLNNYFDDDTDQEEDDDE